MVEPVAGVLGSAVLLLGLTLSTIGMIGLLRKADVFAQLHAAGLITGPGVILVLVASLASGKAEIATSALLIVAFVLVTSSLSTHAIAHGRLAGGGRPPPASDPLRHRPARGADAGAHRVRRLARRRLRQAPVRRARLARPLRPAAVRRRGRGPARAGRVR